MRSDATTLVMTPARDGPSDSEREAENLKESLLQIAAMEPSPLKSTLFATLLKAYKKIIPNSSSPSASQASAT